MAQLKQKKGKGDRLPKRLFRRSREKPPASEPQIRDDSTGREKMSDVLEDFVDPYWDMADDADALRKLLSLAVLAWDAALLPEPKRQAMIDDTLGAGFSRASEADRAQAREFVELMVKRKLEHFPDNRRAIISFTLTDTGTGYHLSVASSL
jgi:arylsulfatase A-like enzyme